MIGDIVFTLVCMAYFVGGITIGYYVFDWKAKKKGSGRWD